MPSHGVLDADVEDEAESSELLEPLGYTESIVLRGVGGPEVDVGVPGVFVDLFEYQPGELDSLSCGCHGGHPSGSMRLARFSVEGLGS